jgi:hypothetical protein
LNGIDLRPAPTINTTERGIIMTTFIYSGSTREEIENAILEQLPNYTNEAKAIVKNYDEQELHHCYAVVMYADDQGLIKEEETLIEMKQLDKYYFLPDVHNDRDLGLELYDSCGYSTNSESLYYYIDFERFGRDVYCEQGGIYTALGYICEE